MDRHLIFHRETAYRVSQPVSVLIIVLRVILDGTRPDAGVWFTLGSSVAGVLLLGSICRILGGTVAGAISLLLISFSPELIDFRPAEAFSFVCLVSLMWLLLRRDWTGEANDFLLSLSLAAVTACGSLTDAWFVLLSPVVGFAYLLLRYVGAGSTRPYRILWHSMRTHRSTAGLRGLIIVLVPPLFLAVRWVHDSMRVRSLGQMMFTDPLQYAGTAFHLFLKYLGPQKIALLTMLVPIGSLMTIWWLFVSVQLGEGLPFSLTAIPVTYLLTGSLTLNSSGNYGTPVHPILTANLITFVSLWLRGRANKRVLDSTGN